MNKTNVNLNPQIERFLMQPMAINLGFGFSQMMTYMEELNIAQMDGAFLRKIWKKKLEENKPSLFEFSETTGLNFVNNNIRDGKASNGIAVVNLKGTMRAEGGLCSMGIDSTCNQLKAAANNPNIIGTILNTHSGGGEVVAAQRLANAIMDARKIKPVVQYVNGMSASGAVFSGVYSDEIVAGGKTAEIGSVGVVIQMNKEWVSYLKENIVSIFADQSSEKQEVFQAILNDDFDFVKKISLNPLADEFQKLVKRERKGVDNSALKGRMFLAAEAKSLGLIDSIGTMEDAARRIQVLARKKNRTKASRKVMEGINF